MKQNYKLVNLLSDGKFYSGEVLGEALGVSRAAVWKQIQQLEGLGVVVDSVKGKGYRVEGGVDLLDVDTLKSHIGSEASELITAWDLLISTGSTNQVLLNRAELQQSLSGAVCLAEQQSSGRGRRGREWVSPFGCNCYCSVLWRFEMGMAALDGLSLVVALALIEALNDYGVPDLGLKWPNDILCEDKKLAGILIEISGDVNNCCQAVIGFGVNFKMPAKDAEDIDQAWTDVESLLGKSVDRNRLSALMIEKVMLFLKTFEAKGFSAFAGDWQKWDMLSDKEVYIQFGNEKIEGVSKGVNENGALLLETEEGLRVFHGGEVSLRAKV